MGKGHTGKITDKISSNKSNATTFDYDAVGFAHGEIKMCEETEQRMKIFIPATERKIRYFM